jgi:cobalt-zinc-cadmium resistance protein CzcA
MFKQIMDLITFRKGLEKLSFILLAMYILPCIAEAQETTGNPLNLDEAVTNALNNNPEIRIAGLQVAKSKIQALEFKPMEFTYQYGQMYSHENARYFEINQNFGSLLTHIQRHSMKKRQAEAILSELEIHKRSLIVQVKSAYYFWWFIHEKQLLGKEETDFFADVQRIAELRYQLGEYSELEKTMASARAAEVENSLDVLSDEVMIAENKLKQLMMTEDDLNPPVEPLPMYSIDKSSDSAVVSNAIITAFYKKDIEVRSAALKTERSKFFPEISAGFFYQDIYPVKGLTGWQVGFSFPLLAFSQTSKIKAAKIDEDIALNQLEYMAFSTDKTIENLVAELTKYFRQIQYYDEYALKQADEIMRNARLQFEKENIEYLMYTQSISMALSIKKRYLETLNDYNQTAIQLEFYAY